MSLLAQTPINPRGRVIVKETRIFGFLSVFLFFLNLRKSSLIAETRETRDAARHYKRFPRFPKKGQKEKERERERALTVMRR